MAKAEEGPFLTPFRFIVFLLLLVVLLTYVAIKWERFGEETVATDQGDLPILSVDSGSAAEEGTQAAFNYFIEARLQREKARSAQQSILREIIDNPNSDSAVRTRAQEELLQLARVIGRETELEELLIAKGFNDVLVYLHDEAAVVVVRAEALTGEEVARIADIVNRFADIPLQAMSIIPKAQ